MNIRTAFFTMAEVDALLRHVPDPDLRDFICSDMGHARSLRRCLRNPPYQLNHEEP